MNITTKIFHYRFDTSNEEEAEAYGAFKSKLEAEGLVCFDSLAAMNQTGREYRSKIEGLHGQEIELETSVIFNNQWNTAQGLRVFDWAESIYPNEKIKEGHYLEQTDEMLEIRQSQVRCHYCGKMDTLDNIKTYNKNTEPDSDLSQEEHNKADQPRCPSCKRGGYLINLNSKESFDFLTNEDIES